MLTNFPDMSSKSANYCFSYLSGNHALLLLCEAELGKPMQELTKALDEAAETAAKMNALSTLGKGLVGPAGWKDAACVHPSLAGVLMVSQASRREQNKMLTLNSPTRISCQQTREYLTPLCSTMSTSATT